MVLGNTSYLFVFVLLFELPSAVKPSSGPFEKKSVTENYNAVLDCIAKDPPIGGKPASYSWNKDGSKVTDPRLSVLATGALFIRGARRTDSGTYQCIVEQEDKDLPTMIPRVNIVLDVQYPPSIVAFQPLVKAIEGHTASLSCRSVGNPSVITTIWSTRGMPIDDPRFKVLPNGTLEIRDVKYQDSGRYRCVVSNHVGEGESKITTLQVQVPPQFTSLPPKTIKVGIGDEVTMICTAKAATSPKVFWNRVKGFFPRDRSYVKHGNLTLVNMQLEDRGFYKCTARTPLGSATHTTEVIVISKPNKPTITDISIINTKAIITWVPGGNGEHVQTFEVWYRDVLEDELHWKTIKGLDKTERTCTVTDLNPSTQYLFSVRGMNSEGPGPFSKVVQNGSGDIPSQPGPLDKQDKPLPPQYVIVNVTLEGYYIAWSHTTTPGRPNVKSFLLEFKNLNASSGWEIADSNIPPRQRVYLLTADRVVPGDSYHFKLFAYGGEYSEPAYATTTFMIAVPAGVTELDDEDNNITILAGVFGAVGFLLVAGLVIGFLLYYKRKRVPRHKKIDRRIHVKLKEGGQQTSDEDIDDDFQEIKFRPEASRFIPDEPAVGNLHTEPNTYTPRDDELLIPVPKHSFTARAAVNTPPVTNNNNVSYVKSRSPSPAAPVPSSVPGKVLAVRYFDGDVGHEWIDCASKIPEAPDLLNTKSELRDSYDSFCHSVSEFGSRDSINAFSNRPILYEKYGSKINVVRNYDSMGTLDRQPYCAHPRVQTRRVVKSRGRGRGKGDRWSMPEFRSYCYKKGLDWNGQGSPGQERDSMTEESGELGFLSIIESGSEESEVNSPPTQKKKSSKGSLGKLSKKNSKSSDIDSSSKGSRGSKSKISIRKNSDSENSQTSGFGNLSSDSESSSISSRELVSGDELHLKNDQALLNLQRTESFLKSVGEEPEPLDETHDFRNKPPMITTLDLSSITQNNTSEDMRKDLRCDPCAHQSRLRNGSCDTDESSGIGSHDSSIPASSSETNSIDSASPREILKSHSKARLKCLERGKHDSNSSCPNSPPHSGVSSKPSLTQSDSGYDGLCPSIEESDEWDCLDYDPTHMIPVSEENVSYDSIMGLQKSLGVELSSDSDGENSICSSSITSPRSCKEDELGSSLNSVDKDKRCKMLIEEFKNKKKKEDRNTNSSIYRTSHV